MDRIKRFIECLIPVTVCNLECSYCYVIQRRNRTEKIPEIPFSSDQIRKGLSQERFGGICYISICGAGETLVPKEMPGIIKCLLEEGHYVNVTTNGTLKRRFDEIITLPREILQRLNFSFSFHYIELLRINKLDEFFSNIRLVKEAGCSFIVQINLCDQYIPYLEEIKGVCLKNVGALPQVAATRNELSKKISLLTKLTYDEYKKIGDTFHSPLFDFTMKNFMVKRKEFCYAGDWSFALNLCTGELKKCYCSYESQKIFDDINKPIKFEAIGNNCRDPFCGNSSHFLSLGTIPELEAPTYAELRSRDNANWYSISMRKFLSVKLSESNKTYSKVGMFKANLSEFWNWNIKRNFKRVAKRIKSTNSIKK